MTKTKTKKQSNFGLGKVILTLILCIAAVFIMNWIIPDEPVIVRTVDPSTTIPITTTTDPQPVILGSIEKIKAANVYLVISFGETAKIGSGTIIEGDALYYYAITNAHVLDDHDAEGTIKTVTTIDGITSDFEILSLDNETDLALIRFSAEGRSEMIPLQIGEGMDVDDLVIAIGNPLGEVRTVSVGFVIGFGSYDEVGLIHQVIIHSATIGSGSSGGALVDMYGNLVGINTWSDGGEYYAIPISVIQGFIETQNIEQEAI
jgi:S1-C subfamily serine protease